MTKEAINKRFIMAVEFLLKSNDYNKAYISSLLKISPSKFSEILNNRMNVGADTLGLFCINFDVNPDWILTGRGNKLIIRNDDFSHTKDDYIIELQKDRIDSLEKELKEIKKQKESNYGYRNVAEPDQ